MRSSSKKLNLKWILSGVAKFLILLGVGVCLSGCLQMYVQKKMDDRECRNLAKKGKKKELNFDFSATPQVGELIIKAHPTSSWVTEEYLVQIDKNKFSVYKYSDTTIRLDAGAHKFEMWLGAFGMTKEKRFVIRERERLVWVYKPPLTQIHPGKILEASKVNCDKCP